MITFQDAFRRTSTTAHRIAYREWVGPIPKGNLVLHRCDNRVCVNPAHLFLGTQRDNIRDMVKKGRDKFNRNGCISDYERQKRINALKSGKPLAEMAADAGIDEMSFKRWAARYCRVGFATILRECQILRDQRDVPLYTICESQKQSRSESAANLARLRDILLLGSF
jgi:hypothetical protein